MTFLKKISLIIIAFSTIGLGACNTIAPIVPVPSEIPIHKHLLQTKLNQKMPIIKKIGLHEFTANSASIELNAEQQRVLIDLKAGINGVLMRPQIGSIKLSSRLAINTPKQQLLLKEVNVENINFPEVPSAILLLIGKPIELMLEHYLEGYAAYELKPEDLKFLGIAMQIDSVKIENDRLIANVSRKTP